MAEFLGVSASTAACTGNAMAVSEQNFKYFTPLKVYIYTQENIRTFVNLPLIFISFVRMPLEIQF